MIIGLTGGIATGKSSVAKALEELGASILDADVIAREVVEPGTPAFEEISKAFPETIREGRIDRKKLGCIVFGDPQKRQLLNGIVHPRIIQDIRRRLEESPAPLVVLVVPLLFEAGMETLVDEVWVVKVSEETQRERLMQRDQLTEAAARERIQSQWPLAEKIRRADVVIDNEAAPEVVKWEVGRILKERLK